MKSEFEVAPASDPVTAEPLVGVASWPGVISSFRLGGAEQSPTLVVSVSTGADWLPGPLDRPESLAEQAARYRLICSQLEQPELTVSLLSTLKPGQALPVVEGASTLRRFAAAAELFAMAAVTVTPPDLKGLGTLDELLDGYGVLAADLATANAGRPLNSLLAVGQPLAMRTGQLEPDLVPSDASTLAEVATRLGVTPERLLEDNRGLGLAVEPSLALPGIVALPAEATLSRPLAVLAGDGPLTAAEVQAQHSCPTGVFAAANAAVLGVLQPGVRLNVAAGTVTTAEHDTLNAVLRRLAAQGLPVSVAELLAANASTPLFRAGARVLLPPQPVTLSASGSLVGTFAAPIFELAVTLRLERPVVAEKPVTPDAVTPDAVTPDAVTPDPTPASLDATPDADPDPVPAPVERADSLVPAPAWHDPAFEAVVNACLLAVPSIRLATRKAASQETEADDALWAVAFGEQGITSVRLQPPAGYAGARFLAPRPLYPELLHFDAPISELTAPGTLGQPTQQAFSGIDVERWARRFLTDLDRYLDTPFAALLSDTPPTALLAARRDLADAIAAGAAVVLAPDLPSQEPVRAAAPDQAAGLADAQAALAAACRSGSATGYGSVAVQHSVAAVTRFEPAQAAQLSGVVWAGGLPQPSTTELSRPDGWSTFALDASWQDTSHGGQTSAAVDCDQAFHSLTTGSGTAGAGDRVNAGDRVTLSFTRPLAGDHLPKDVHAELGVIELPLVQRLLPAPATLDTIAAQPSWTAPDQPTLRQAAGWTLAVSYSHEHSAHDEVRLSIWHAAPTSSNAAGSGPFAQAGTAPNPALAVALARYLAVADQLAALLGWYAKAPKGADTALRRRVRESALATLAELISAVAEAWGSHTSNSPTSNGNAAGPSAGQPSAASLAADTDADAADRAAGAADRAAGAARTGRAAGTDGDAEGGADGEQCREYRLRACYTCDADGGRQFERLVVTAGQPDDWPTISWLGSDNEEPLTPGPVADGQRSYTPARPIAASQSLAFRVELAGLNAVSQQTARAGVSVSRNAALRAGMRTCPEFVSSSSAHTSNRVSPGNTWPEPIALAGASVAQALQNCFDTLFGPRPGAGQLNLDISYSYLIDSTADADSTGSAEGTGSAASAARPAQTDPGLRAVLPVASLPMVDLAPDLAASLAETVEGWHRQAEPPTEGAQWHFALALLSPRPGEPALLAFDQLVFAD